ncbi:thioesterase II family protein [Micromonospora sp. KC721]|uniref:thioesterase II family protein n=1 Tax=Micromonospora sp. KC721 TaxID=2530380 RepID=UPI00104ACDB8|nr:alpha/beta fold hydrolase [Micromonospora sp. KC721]TDB82469.1 thioesterase [Micromonospora sp. KC721]
MNDPEIWFQRWASGLTPTYRLVCFPHAGGSATFYRGWAAHLPGAEVLAVRYPGRAERIEEPPPADLKRLARDIAEALAPWTDLPIALFGHSMGAAVALETARALEAAGTTIRHLFASGSRDAPLPDPADPADSGDTDERATIEQLASIGGTSREMLEDPMFRELVLPYVIADSRMFHAYRMSTDPILHSPVTVLTGDRDDHADLRPWGTLTVAPVARHMVPGDHFYLVDEPPYDVLNAVRPALVGRQPSGSDSPESRYAS